MAFRRQGSCRGLVVPRFGPRCLSRKGMMQDSVVRSSWENPGEENGSQKSSMRPEQPRRHRLFVDVVCSYIADNYRGISPAASLRFLDASHSR